MIPSELEPHWLELPTDGDASIVIATGDEPRHLRFALRIQQEFGRQVVAWYQLASPPGAPVAAAARAAVPMRRRAKMLVARLLGRGPGARPAAPRPSSLFLREVELLRRHAVVEPRIISRSDVHGQRFVSELAALRPFFFLTLGGGLYGADVLNTVRGVAINQHAGFSPDYKGNQTTLQALYRRDLDRVASTVHVTTTGADAGPILRRSHPCLTPRDTPLEIAERVVALGTELMLECVREICDSGRIRAFPQPLAGRTYLARECDGHIRGFVNSDFERGWLRHAIARRREW